MTAIPDIYIAAIVTSILSLGIIGGLLLYFAPKENRSILYLLILVMLPMNALAFYLVRMPLDTLLLNAFSKGNGFYQFMRMIYAPLTEEPAKLWPLLIPWFYRRISSVKTFRAALAIGLGFGVGEAWTVAHLLSRSPAIAQYPWYMLINERVMVCIIHSAFTAVALHFIIARKRIVVGILTAMGLHFVGNSPIFLASWNVFGIGRETWQVILQLWVLFYFLAMGALLILMAYGRQKTGKSFLGEIECPECKKVYKRSMLTGINLLHKRYEPCPHCKHWHIVPMFGNNKELKS